MIAGLEIQADDVVEIIPQRRRQADFLAELLVGFLQCGIENIGAGEVAVTQLVILEVCERRDRLKRVLAERPVERQHRIGGIVETEVAVRRSNIVLRDVANTGVRTKAELQDLVILQTSERPRGGRLLVDDFDLPAVHFKFTVLDFQRCHQVVSDVELERATDRRIFSVRLV